MSQPDQPEPDQPQPGQPQPGHPQPGQPAPSEPTGWEQPGTAPGWQPPPGTAPGWQPPPGTAPGWPPAYGGQQGWPQAYGGQQAWPQTPGWPPGQPGEPPPYGWTAQTRFDPNDPLISDDYSGWWQRSTAVLRRGWRPLVALQLVIALPALALQLPAEIYSERQQQELETAMIGSTGTPDISAVLVPLSVVVAAALVSGVVYALGTLASMRMVAVVATGGVPRIGDAFGAAARRMPAMIGWYILSGLLAIAAFIACFLPVIYVGAVLVILPAVVLFERGSAIPRCFRLFHADIGAALARVATIGGLAVVGGIVMAVLSTVATLALSSPAAVGTATGSTGGFAVGTVTALLNAVYAVVVGVVGVPLIVTAYADMRARHEPFTSAALVDPPAV